MLFILDLKIFSPKYLWFRKEKTQGAHLDAKNPSAHMQQTWDYCGVTLDSDARQALPLIHSSKSGSWCLISLDVLHV